MQKVDLNKVLEMLINEEHEQADGLLHQWFVEKTRTVHEGLMQDDDAILENNDLTQGLEDDQEEIKSEEYYSDAELSEEGDEEEAEVEGDVDAPAEFGGEMDVEPESIEDKVEDLESQLARLTAEFEKIMGAHEDDHGADIDGNGEVGDVEFVEPAEEGLTFEAKEEDKDEDEALEESDEFFDLEESFELEAVKDPNLNGGKEIGADGASVSVNDVSPIPQKKGADRVGGKAVEIKAKEHKGYNREAAPTVNTKPLLKNQVKNAKSDLVGVSKEGDKSAVLNKKDGFGSDSPKSPIGAGAADLRGNDFKRK